MSNENELLPCPFCGSAEVSPSSWDVKCSGCGAEMPGGTQQAIERWNRRPTLSDEAVERAATSIEAQVGQFAHMSWGFYQMLARDAITAAFSPPPEPSVVSHELAIGDTQGGLPVTSETQEPAPTIAENATVAPAPSSPVPVEAVGWQPIETAPKDGSIIDLFADGQRWSDCYWGKPLHFCGEAGQYCDSDWHSEPDGWTWSAVNEPFPFDEPTHWMPLPAAPAHREVGK